MTPDLLHCDPASEGYKGHIHLALGSLAAVCCAYNGGAFTVRPSKPLAFQTVLYGAVMLHEWWRAREHFAASGGRTT